MVTVLSLYPFYNAHSQLQFLFGILNNNNSRPVVTQYKSKAGVASVIRSDRSMTSRQRTAAAHWIGYPMRGRELLCRTDPQWPVSEITSSVTVGMLSHLPRLRLTDRQTKDGRH